jgi:murein DD-endopeptidase MepM/ murein hydrolase activator NlpD
MRTTTTFIILCSVFLSCESSSPDNGKSASIEAKYVLPYPVGTTYTCSQGPVGRWSHSESFKYAVDFTMPIGTIVTASRGGRVVFVEESFTDDNWQWWDQANVVIVLHDDSTYGRYVHLTQNGAVVERFQIVAQGDTIGLSGSSGTNGGPHLHFDVTRDCPTYGCNTIPVYFENTAAHPDGLVTGKSYTAEPY